MRVLFLSAAAVIGIAAPAHAVTCLAGNTASLASASDISPTALACEGRFDKNILDNNAGDVLLQRGALHDLGFDWDGTNFGGFTKLAGIPSTTHIIDFGQAMYGLTYIGFHAGGKGGGSTSFYKFDAGLAGMTSFTWVNTDAFPSSGAVLYSTGSAPSVPEPASWALMLGGFATIGGVLRNRRRPAVSFG